MPQPREHTRPGHVPAPGLVVVAAVLVDVVHLLADGVDPDVITTAEAAAGSVPGVIHAHAQARWTGRTLQVEIEAWVVRF